MSKEVPILFNGDMVRAILENRKTQTRRPVLPEIPADCSPETQPVFYDPACYSPTGDIYPGAPVFGVWGDEWGRVAPARPGDTLWVRETWQGPMWPGELDAEPIDAKSPKWCAYAATDPKPEYIDAEGDLHCRWRPSIHMPRWAARLFLPVVSVRCERVEDITEEDAHAEAFPSAAAYLAWWREAYPGKDWCWVYGWKAVGRA